MSDRILDGPVPLPGMPGTPDSVLGHDGLDLLIGVVAGGVVTAVPFVQAVSRDLYSLTLAGVGYAVSLLCLWAGVRLVADAFPGSLLANPQYLAGFLVLGGLVFTVQFVVPYYLYARWDLVVPLAGLFVATVLVVFGFLHVRGETDPIGLYLFFVGPVLATVTSLLTLLEGVLWKVALGA